MLDSLGQEMKEDLIVRQRLQGIEVKDDNDDSFDDDCSSTNSSDDGTVFDDHLKELERMRAERNARIKA